MLSRALGAVALLGCRNNNGVGQQVVLRTGHALCRNNGNALEGRVVGGVTSSKRHLRGLGLWWWGGLTAVFGRKWWKSDSAMDVIRGKMSLERRLAEIGCRRRSRHERAR